MSSAALLHTDQPVVTTNKQRWLYSIANLGNVIPAQASSFILFFYTDVRRLASAIGWPLMGVIFAVIAAAEAAILFNFTRLKTDPAVDEKFKPYDLMGVVFYATAHPNTVFDISQTREKKHKALDCYRAQFSAEDMAGLHLVLGYREQEAAKGQGFSHGEPLKALPTLRLHVDAEAWKL